MKKSSLLERVLKKAEELSREDGKPRVDSNYFFTALLVVIDGLEADGIIDVGEKNRVITILIKKVNMAYTHATVRNSLKELADNIVLPMI